MPKKDKEAKKRALRRERAKSREGEVLTGVGEQEQAADEAVKAASVAEAPSQAREKRAPRPTRAEERVTAWDRMVAFFTEVKIEAKKINWPPHDETVKSTMVVIITILFLAGFMGLASVGFEQVARRLFTTQTIQAPASVPTNPAEAVPPAGSPTPSGDHPAPSIPY